jgi:hypothetical protein
MDIEQILEKNNHWDKALYWAAAEYCNDDVQVLHWHKGLHWNEARYWDKAL